MYLKVKSAHFKIKAIVAVSVTQTHTHLYSLKAQGVQGYLSTCHFLHFARLCTTNISHVFLINVLVLNSPQIVIAKESPIDDVEQNKWGGKEPPWDPVDQYSLFALLFHHIPNLLLSLQLYVMNKVLDAQLRTYHIISSTTAATHRIRPKASSSTRW